MQFQISKFKIISKFMWLSFPLVGNLSFKKGLRTMPTGRQASRNDRNRCNAAYGSLKLLLTAYCLLLTLSSCGYHMIGSTLMPFNSITIKQVQNKTYEPRLEEKLHNALSREFINQGIKVQRAGGNVEIEATVNNFELGAIGAVDDKIKEQSIIMRVHIKLVDQGKTTEFRAMESPIKITFQSTGTVSESIIHKELAIEKACSEIAKEIVSRIILTYAK
jgi:outer membrane lipopolysaccharide assembly protein LptE/RlpB